MLNKIKSKNVPYLLVIITILFQLVVFGKYINANVFSAIHPFFGDAQEYFNTTVHWQSTGDFVSAFSSGWRLPGYSSFMLINFKIAGLLHCDPLIFLRVVQLLTSAFIPFFSYKALLHFSASEKAAFFGAFITGFYYPFYYFTLMIGAESISLLLISILFWQISFVSIKKFAVKDLFFLGLNIVVLTYLKPNHILFSVPVGIILLKYEYAVSGKLFRSIKAPFILACIVIILLLPWIIFISNENKMFIPLATTSGVDMVIGTGVPQNLKNRDTTSLIYKFEKKYNLQADTIYLHNKEGLTSAEMNRAFQSEAITIWKKRPWVTFKYGLIKIAHFMGLGFRGAKDYFSLLVILPALIILFFNSGFRKKNIHLSLLVSILFILLCLQTFVYFGDMRMRILLFDMPVIYFLSIYIYGKWGGKIGDRFF